MNKLNNDLYLTLSYDDKIKYLNKYGVSKSVRKYLVERLSNLDISVPIYDNFSKKDNILNLMFDGLLEGWCFETTESAIIFLDDYDYIERGYIYINDQNSNYYHSWIVFKYNNREYVLDPSLNFLCTKKNYIKLFNPKTKALVSGKLVKEELIKQLTNKKEFNIAFSDNINDPLYRNTSSYFPEMENNKIKKMKANYYYNN